MSDSKNQDSEDLTGIRQQIDDVDIAIQQLISKRASLAKQIGEAKHSDADSGVVEFYRPEREAQVLRAVAERNEGPLENDEVVRLFREIMSACRAHEEPLKVGYLGPEGTFTQSAVFKHFGHSVGALPLATIEDVFHEVENGAARFGVVPIENSNAGTVNHTLDMFVASSLRICGEVEMRIRQHLLGSMENQNSIKRICAHPHALTQCRAWLAEFLPAAEQIPCSSNAEGARRAKEEEGTAAIAGDSAAEVYGLNVLVSDIEDSHDNTTRFLVIGHRVPPASGEDKTTLIISASDSDDAGSLHKILAPLAEQGINMTRIESRPSHRRKWHYVFFIDIDGHLEDASVSLALSKLEQSAQQFRVLGSYPKAIL
ncbi:MAG: prephenate dehydratase [Gammaproteobacteria bacterium]|nr:prephenate dehydratase [Gammaproteobacteria bacterium]